jgi:hypothetical protein
VLETYFSNVQNQDLSGNESSPSQSTTPYKSAKTNGQEFPLKSSTKPSIPSLQLLLSRTEPDGDCLLWTSTVGGSGYPIIRYAQKTRTVRAMIGVMYGKSKRKGDVYTTICKNKRCLAKDHLRAVSRKVLMETMDKSCYNNPVRSARISEQSRKRGKLTQEQADLIRLSPDTQRVLSERYGVSKRVVWEIKRGIRWKDYKSNFWGGL